MSNLTKTALTNAFKKKINEKELSKITIKELTDECGINRQTFYYHFKDIYDLIKWLYTNEVIEEIKIDDNYLSWQKCYYYIFNYVKLNKKLILNTYNSIAKEYFESFLNKQTSIFISKVIDEKTVSISVQDDTKLFLTNFYKNALIGCLKDWVESGMIENPKDLIYKMECILEGNIDLFFSNLNNKNKTKYIVCQNK